MENYLQQLKNYPTLPRAAFLKLLRQMKKGDETAYDKLIIHNLRLVVYAVKPFQKLVPLDDLIQEGNLALMSALKTYNPRRRAFSTYAMKAIQRRACRLIEKEHAIHLPGHVQQLLYRFTQCEQQAQQIAQRELPPAEVLTQLNLAPTQELLLLHAFEVLHRVPSPDLPKIRSLENGSEDNTDPWDRLVNWTPIHEFQQQFSLERLLAYLRKNFFKYLTDSEQQILILHYGLDHQPEQTLRRISQIINLSTERVRQKEKNALHKLRSLLRQETFTRQEVNIERNFNTYVRPEELRALRLFYDCSAT